MAKRKVIFANGEIYHVYNRTNGKEECFSGVRESKRILALINFYRYPQKVKYSKFVTLPAEEKSIYTKKFSDQPPLVIIYVYAIMPNHFHFLLKQNLDNGIIRFVSNLQNGFAKYFNVKHNRHGSLFQKPFKAKRIEDDEQLIHVSRYIHLNPITSFLMEIERLSDDLITSYPYYVKSNPKTMIDVDFILDMFDNIKAKYSKFISDQVGYQRQIYLIKNLIFD